VVSSFRGRLGCPLLMLYRHVSAIDVVLTGDKAMTHSIHGWLALSPFAKEKRRIASEIFALVGIGLHWLSALSGHDSPCGKCPLSG